LSWGNVGANHS